MAMLVSSLGEQWSIGWRSALCELDADVAAVWETIFLGSRAEVAALEQRILTFNVTLSAVRAVLDSKPRDCGARAFGAIVKNRTQHGGIMAAGAGLVKEGENGRGLRSRWYPETLARRIEVLWRLRGRIDFGRGDAMAAIARFAGDPRAFYFVDPPYTAGGKRAGARLYTHHDLDHPALFAALANVAGAVLMTYDDAPEVRALARRYGFRVKPVPMKNGHHTVMHELLIFNRIASTDCATTRGCRYALPTQPVAKIAPSPVQTYSSHTRSRGGPDERPRRSGENRDRNQVADAI